MLTWWYYPSKSVPPMVMVRSLKTMYLWRRLAATNEIKVTRNIAFQRTTHTCVSHFNHMLPCIGLNRIIYSKGWMDESLLGQTKKSSTARFYYAFKEIQFLLSFFPQRSLNMFNKCVYFALSIGLKCLYSVKRPIQKHLVNFVEINLHFIH